MPGCISRCWVLIPARRQRIPSRLSNKAAGFLRSQLSRDATMRSVPQLRFYFDTSVGQGRHLEDLIRRAADADRELGLRDPDTDKGS